MEDPGQKLREAREGKDITLKEASHATKIGIRFLKALENNEYDAFPGNVYMHYFMKNYANFLGLDAEKLAGAFKPGRNIAEKVQPTEERRLSDVTKKIIAISATMILWWLLWVIYQAVVVKF